MERLEGLKYHKMMIDIIDEFKKAKWGKLIKKSSPVNGLKSYIKPYKKGFSIEFKYDVFSPNRKNLDVGQDHKAIQIEFKNSSFILENIYLENHAMPKFKGSVSRIHTKGFSESKQYYYRLVIPLERELIFHYNIEQTSFSSDLGYNSRCATKAVINEETIEICCINRTKKKKEYYLVVDSDKRQTFEEFSHKTNSVNIGLGYLSGYYAGDQGYFFCYTNKSKKKPKHLRFTELRDSIKSRYQPVYSNSYGYLHRDKLAEKYYKLLRPISLEEFSLLSQRLNDSLEFSSTLILILESSVASLLFMPGGYAIALETMSDLIIGKQKLKIAPIKDKATGKKIRKAFKEIVDEHTATIAPDDLKTLHIRIEQFNQATNKARLRAPFDILKFKLEDEDFKILETRNDFLHGRIPDLTESGPNRTVERINKDLYYSAIRFYTLLNILILKWIGYDNRVVNLPKLHESFTEILLNEEPFRQV